MPQELVIHKLCGEVVVELDGDDISEIVAVYGDSMKALKTFLSRTVHVSRFRQHLAIGSQILQDADLLSTLDLPVTLQLVMVPFLLATPQDLHAMQSAAERNNHIEMQRLLHKRIDPDLSLTPGHSKALHIATTFGSLACLQLLLEAGANLQSLDEDGKSALSHAATMGNVEITRELLAAGAKNDAASNGGEYPLCTACRRGHLGVVRELLDARLKPTALQSTEQLLQPVESPSIAIRQALHIATKLGQTDSIQLLLGARGDVEAKDNHDKSLLWHAAQIGHTDVVRLLLQAGARTGAEATGEDHPLWAACRNGRWDVVHCLIDARAHVHAADATANSPSWIADWHGYVDIVHHLATAGENPSTNSSASPLWMASCPGQSRMAQALPASRADSARTSIKIRAGASPCASDHLHLQAAGANAQDRSGP
ncbi:ANK3 [Symbiodinium natans]|uniref:ANK3 protein n=1 Tax=Symbiodinium natans TaxID=878477 RepID=A0A812I1M5_9DINO|nr:ANK3 [Symbiodinium natans]